MLKFSGYIIPILTVILLCVSLVKKNNAFDSFAIGAKKGLDVALGVFPFLASIFVLVTLFKVSGLAHSLTNLCKPVFDFFKIPPELMELVIIKPFSGSGTLVELESIYATYGVDSYISRCASVVLGSSDTLFYISAIYFSKCDVKKLSYGIPLALVVTFFGMVFSCFLCRYI